MHYYVYTYTTEINLPIIYIIMLNPILILILIMMVVILPIIIIPVLILLFIASIIDMFTNLFSSKDEQFADDYSLRMHEMAINKMRRWNLNHSQRYSNINNILPTPPEYRCHRI